jgi:5-methylcytosine-specific restriction endonuclease McrA
MAKLRNYRKEYDEYHGLPDKIKERGDRNTARADAVRRKVVTKGDGKHIDHINPIKNGGSNNRNNLRVVDAKTNLKKGSRHG